MHHYDKHTDNELIALLKEDCVPAFDEIYNRHWKKLFNEAYKRLNNLELCEELVQDIFIDLWNKRNEREISRLYAYLVTAVQYQVIFQYKKSKSLPHFEEPLEQMLIDSNQADSYCFEKELIWAIERWLDLQPEKKRRILKLRYLDGIPTKEIADQLNISQKTVQNQINTSQANLRAFLMRFLLLSALLVSTNTSTGLDNTLL